MAKSISRKIGEEPIELRPLDVCPMLEVDEESEEDSIKLRSAHAEFSLLGEKTAPLFGADPVRVVEVEYGQPATIPESGGAAFVKCRMLRISLVDILQILAQIGHLNIWTVVSKRAF